MYGLPLEYKDCRFDELGYLYNDEDQVIARVENYEELFAPVIDKAEDYDFVVVDGVQYYPIAPDEGYPYEFAYYDDYGKIFDNNFNYYLHRYSNIYLFSTL